MRSMPTGQSAIMPSPFVSADVSPETVGMSQRSHAAVQRRRPEGWPTASVMYGSRRPSGSIMLTLASYEMVMRRAEMTGSVADTHVPLPGSNSVSTEGSNGAESNPSANSHSSPE